MIGLGFVIDVATGRDLSLSIVYVAGVGLMTWTGSLRVGVLGAIAGAAAVPIDGLPNSVAFAVGGEPAPVTAGLVTWHSPNRSSRAILPSASEQSHRPTVVTAVCALMVFATG